MNPSLNCISCYSTDDVICLKEDKQIRPDGESTSANVSPQIKMCTSRYYQTIDVSPAPIKFPVS